MALIVTPANEQDRPLEGDRAQAVQETTAQSCKSLEAKTGFVLLPKRWVIERSFGWLARFRRLDRDYERLPETLKGLHFLAFAILMAQRFVACLAFCL